MGKIIDKNDFAEIRKQAKKRGEKIILCHGVFDLIHPGHIQHFQEAKKQGDILVVSITAEQYVRKGLGRPYFNDELRMRSLAALECIDYVLLSESYTVADILEFVRPDLYVKGQEYENEADDITGKILEEIALVRQYGGDIYYTKGDVFSSTKLINAALPVFSDDMKKYLTEFRKNNCMDDILNCANKMSELKVLVVGDVIIDDYIFCKVQGMMSKNMGYSARYIKEEMYLGGSLAIGRNLADFTSNVTVMSIIGEEEKINSQLEKESKGKFTVDFVKSELFHTIVKKRYVEPDDKRKELDKIFVINNLSESMGIDKSAMDNFKEKLKKKINNFDVVFLCDFGHGLIDDEVIEIIQNNAKQLILNCQTNSSNYGLNLITKYSKTDFFTIDEKELRLAFSDYKQSADNLLERLERHLKGHGWLTRGSKGAVSIENGNQNNCPAFVLDVTDTIGAGDAFFALAGLAVAAGGTVEQGTFLGNIAGALAANIVGNKEHLEKVNILKYASTLLNF